VQLRDKTARALPLGSASPAVVRKSGEPEPDDRNGYGKLASEMQAEEVAWRDSQPIVTSCAFCGWSFDGTAVEGRMAALRHREAEHPEAIVKRRRRKGVSSKRSGLRTEAENEQAQRDRAEANRERTEREQAEQLAKIERGRQRDALAALDAGEPQSPVTGARAADPEIEEDDVEATATSNGKMERGAAQLAVLKAIADGAATPALMASAIGREPKYASVILIKLREKGFVEKIGYGEYAITAEGRAAAGAGQPLDAGSGREPQALAPTTTAEGSPAAPAATAGPASRPGKESEPETSRAPARRNVTAAGSEISVRDPIRTADIPYDADILENEASFLRERAAALEVIAGGLRQLAAIGTEPGEIAA
jgi:hypothetical protein